MGVSIRQSRGLCACECFFRIADVMYKHSIVWEFGSEQEKGGVYVCVCLLESKGVCVCIVSQNAFFIYNLQEKLPFTGSSQIFYVLLLIQHATTITRADCPHYIITGIQDLLITQVYSSLISLFIFLGEFQMKKEDDLFSGKNHRNLCIQFVENLPLGHSIHVEETGLIIQKWIIIIDHTNPGDIAMRTHVQLLPSRDLLSV